MTLLDIAQLLGGEARLAYGGVVDAETACGWESFHWDEYVRSLAATEAPSTRDRDRAGARTPLAAVRRRADT